MPLYKLSDDKVIEWARAIVSTIDKHAVSIKDENEKEVPKAKIQLPNAYQDQNNDIWVRVPRSAKSTFMNHWADHDFSSEYLEQLFRQKS